MSVRVQHLLKQRSIVLKEGDIETFSAVWRYVRNEEFNQGLGLKLPSGSQGNTSGVKSEGDNGKQILWISKTSQVKGVENKKNETGTNVAQNHKEKIFMNSSSGDDDNNIVSTRVQTNTLNNNENTNTKTPSKNIHRNNTLDKNQRLLETDSHLTSKHQGIPPPREGYRWNVTRCFPAFQRMFNNHVLLAEVVAASRALGVDHFIFYVESVGSEVNLTLQVLKSRGLVEVLPWNMHMQKRDLFYKGQISAIQDCLYRHLRSSRYVLTGDVDELFVPKTDWSLVPLLNRWFVKKPDCGSFQFLNSFCNVDLPPVQPSQSHGKSPTHITNTTSIKNTTTTTNTTSNKTITNGTLTSNSDNNPNLKNSKNTNAYTDSNSNHDKKSSNNTINAFTDINKNNNNSKHIYSNFHNSNIVDIDPVTFSMAMQYKLPIFLHSMRHVRIWKPGQRSKIALDPRKVLVGSVHVVDTFRKGFRSCVMSEQEGLLHHYRGFTGAEKVPVVEDNSVRVYGATYVKEAVAILKEVEMEKMERDGKND